MDRQRRALSPEMRAFDGSNLKIMKKFIQFESVIFKPAEGICNVGFVQ